MDARFRGQDKAILENCLDGCEILRKEIRKIIEGIYVKLEDPSLTDPEIRSYLGQIKGVKLALGIIPGK